MADGLGNINFGIRASDYIQQPTELVLGHNMNDYANMYGRYTNIDGVVSGKTPSLYAFNSVDVTKAPSVFSEKGLMDWTSNEAFKLDSGAGGTGGAGGDTDTDIGSGFMDWMGTDSAKNTLGLGSLGLGVFNIFNTRSAQKQAKKMWEAENARANELMAMNKEKYETYKADKAKLNSQYI